MALISNENNYLRIVAINYDFRADYLIIVYELWENETHRKEGSSKFRLPIVQTISLNPVGKVNELISTAYQLLKAHPEFMEWKDG